MKRCTIATWLALSAVPGLAAAQARRVTGRVSVSAGESIAGANVAAVTAPAGVVTDETGRFVISVPSGTTALVVRHIGYHRADVPLPPGSDSVTVVLQRDVLELDRLVVTGVATTVSSRNAANDVAHVDADAVRQVSTPSIESVLSGRASGVQVLAN